MSIVSLEHIHKSYGDNPVLRDISISVDKGEVVGIIGPSGGGKSTLLRCATLLEHFDSGSLTYDDIVVAKNDAQGKAEYAGKDAIKRAKSKFGLVFQNFNLFSHYTVMRNITEPPQVVQGRSKDEVYAQAKKLISQMGLEGKEDMVPCDLSGGQQQRVAIARALCMNPEILYFDEPTSALDPELTQEVLRVIRGLADQHMTMVIVTHEMNFARDVADRVVFMDGGVIVEEGPAKQVIEHPQKKRTQDFLRTYEG
jgi:polar amino acid transport system ATP-binding protein